MRSVWDLKAKLTFLWKTYGHIYFIVMGILLDFPSLWIRYGSSRFKIPQEGLLSHSYSIAMTEGILPLLLYGNDKGILLSVKQAWP